MRSALLLVLLAFPLSAAPPAVKVRLRSGVTELPLEHYVAGVLAGESGVFRSDEALKAMAVAARTFAVHLRGRHSREGYDFCSTTHCQLVTLDGITARAASAVEATAGELVWFEGRPAFTPYSRDCGGRTEDVAAVWSDLAVPYLAVREDAYCVRTGLAGWRWNAGVEEIAGALRRAGLQAPRRLEGIVVAERTTSGRARNLLLSGGGESVRVSASAVRFAVGRQLGWNLLRSERFDIRPANDRLVFEGSGSGHGVGLCQRGADLMGAAGRSYREILAFYYPGTVVGLSGSGLRWQRLAGNTVSLLTVRPDQDRVVLAIAERLLRSLEERTHWTAPAGLEVRAYPDLESFRNATAEPGWVAGHTEGRRVHLQPVPALRARGLLESVLHHELAHVLLEAHAAPGLPLWFREGLAGYLARPARAAAARIPSESDLRQIGDPARARRAYEDAAASVSNLVQRHGEGMVLGWVSSGLPREKEVTAEAPRHREGGK